MGAIRPADMALAALAGLPSWRSCCLALDAAWNENARMDKAVALAHHTGVRLAEVGFLLILFAGIWLAAAQIPRFRLGTARMIVAGIALALGGLLLIIATHWGRFG
jgi:hypothetical protein